MQTTSSFDALCFSNGYTIFTECTRWAPVVGSAKVILDMNLLITEIVLSVKTKATRRLLNMFK